MKAQAIILRIYIYFPKGTYYFDATHSKFKIVNSVKDNATFVSALLLARKRYGLLPLVR